MIEQEIRFRGQAIAYRVRFNPRRRTRSLIRILPDGGVLVDAPPSAGLRQIRDWVRSQAEWLLRTRGEIAETQGFVAPLQHVAGEQHLFLGQGYPLMPVPARRGVVAGVRDGSLVLPVSGDDPERVKAALWRWYRCEARSLFERRLAALAAVVPWVERTPPLRVRRMRRRWGSCNAQGTVTLNTHLLKARRELIDYVILHELCHLRELNHSPRFYRLMDQVMPQWRELKHELDAQAHRIGNE